MERTPPRHNKRRMEIFGLDIGVIAPAVLGLAATALALRRAAARDDRD